MDYCNGSRAMKRRRVMREEDGQSSSLFKILPEDMLMEILLQPPDSAAAVRSGAVCKAWHSLVSSPEFIPAFCRQQQQHSPLPFTVLHIDKALLVKGRKPIAASPIKLDMAVSATCDDLIVGLMPKSSMPCVYNPATRQRLVLPERSPLHRGRCALTGRLSPTTHRYEFRVIQFGNKGGAVIFSSETGRWTDPVFAPRVHLRFDVAACKDGTLFWIQNLRKRRAVVFDPFGGGTCSHVSLPEDLVTQGSEFVRNRMATGVVRGRVRVSQLFRVANGSQAIKVWELDARDGHWQLVHNVAVRSDPAFYVLVSDPHDGDVIYLCREPDIYRFDMVNNKYTLILRDSTSPLRRTFAFPFILTRPVWPTAIPALPSGTTFSSST